MLKKKKKFGERGKEEKKKKNFGDLGHPLDEKELFQSWRSHKTLIQKKNSQIKKKKISKNLPKEGEGEEERRAQ